MPGNERSELSERAKEKRAIDESSVRSERGKKKLTVLDVKGRRKACALESIELVTKPGEGMNERAKESSDQPEMSMRVTNGIRVYSCE